MDALRANNGLEIGPADATIWQKRRRYTRGILRIHAPRIVSQQLFYANPIFQTGNPRRSAINDPSLTDAKRPSLTIFISLVPP